MTAKSDAEAKNVAAEKGLSMFDDEFLQGQWDCMSGKPHREGLDCYAAAQIEQNWPDA